MSRDLFTKIVLRVESLGGVPQPNTGIQQPGTVLQPIDYSCFRKVVFHGDETNMSRLMSFFIIFLSNSLSSGVIVEDDQKNSTLLTIRHVSATTKNCMAHFYDSALLRTYILDFSGWFGCSNEIIGNQFETFHTDSQLTKAAKFSDAKIQFIPKYAGVEKNELINSGLDYCFLKENCIYGKCKCLNS